MITLSVCILMPLLILAPSAWTQCDYSVLESDVPITISTVSEPAFFQFTQNVTGWMAVGVRPPDGISPELLIYESTAPYPTCVSTNLAFIEIGNVVNFIVGDFNQAPTGTYYGLVDEVWAPDAEPLEWDQGNGWLILNDSLTTQTMGEDDLIDIWDVYLQAGIEYAFRLWEMSGEGTSQLLFDQPMSHPYWKTRQDALFEDKAGGPIQRFTPTNSGTYGLVVVKDTSQVVTYHLAVGECLPPRSLKSGVSVHPRRYQNHYEFDQQWAGWTAIGCQDQSAAGLSLNVFGSLGPFPYPYCFSDNLLSTGAVGAVIAIRNFDTPAGPLYLNAAISAGHADPMLEWEGQGGTLAVDGPPAIVETGPTDVLELWGVSLVEGETYTIHFDKEGELYPHITVFAPNDSTWMGVQHVADSWDRDFDYQAENTGSHAIVVFNTNGEFDRYTVGVSSCGTAPSLNYGAYTLPTPPAETSGRFLFNQTEKRWAGVAIYSDADWDLDLYEHPCGTAAPLCFSGHLAHSGEAGAPPAVDFIVGDFNRNPLGEHYVHAQYSGGTFTEADVYWDGGWDLLVPGVVEARGLDPNNILDVWDAPLIAGHEYQIHFERTSGTADAKLFIFEPSGDTYWAGRTSSILETASSTNFTPTSTGNYGFVVINDNAAGAQYEIGISSSTLPAGPGGPPAIAGIRSLVPNPTTGKLSIQFDVRTPGEIGFEIVDVAGRRIARLPGESWAAGNWTVTWDGNSSTGARLASGVYFVRMKSGSETIGLKKFVLLD
jgi:hypothetical protein